MHTKIPKRIKVYLNTHVTFGVCLLLFCKMENMFSEMLKNASSSYTSSSVGQVEVFHENGNSLVFTSEICLLPSYFRIGV